MTEHIDYSAMSDEDLLRAVVADAFQHPETADFELSQIYAGTVHGDPEQEALWSELTGPENAQVDIHLDGEAVHGHSVDAKIVVDLISGIAKSAKTTADGRMKELREKQTAQKKKGVKASLEGGGGRPVRVAAMSPGSFEFVLEAHPPAAPEKSTEGQVQQDGGVYQPSLDDTALTDVIDALFSDGLDGSLDKLPAGAKKALYPAVEALSTPELEVTSQLVQRNLTPVRRVKRQANAVALKAQLELDHTENRTINRVVKFDGYKQSEDIVYLFIDSEKKSRKVTVEDAAILASLRGWSAESPDELWVEVSVLLKVVTSVKEKTETSLTLTYADKAEKPEAKSDQLTLDEMIAELTPADE